MHNENEIYKQLILKNISFIGRVAEVTRTAFTEKFGLRWKFFILDLSYFLAILKLFVIYKAFIEL